MFRSQILPTSVKLFTKSLIIMGVFWYSFGSFTNSLLYRPTSLETKNAQAVGTTRVKTVEFFAGQYNGSATSQNNNTKLNFSTFTINIPENAVDIKNAFVEFESEFGAPSSLTHNGILVYFDSCVPVCTPSTTAFLTSQATDALGRTTGEAQYLKVLANVTSEGTLDTFTGGTLTAQVSYCITTATSGGCTGTAAASLQAAHAKLVVTYSYSESGTTTEANTVFFPLDSDNGSDAGSRRADQLTCTLDSNCPKFDYNVNLGESSTSQVSQWFDLKMHLAQSATNTADTEIRPQIDGNATGAIHYSEDGLNRNGGWRSFYVDSLAGFATNTNQKLEVGYADTGVTAGTANYSNTLIGGEVVYTYTRAVNEATKTRSVVMPVGSVCDTACTAKPSLVGPTVYFPEAGVSIKSAYFRIKVASISTTASTLRLTTKVGNNNESDNSDYIIDGPTIVTNSNGYFIHVVPSADYAELASATYNSGKTVQLTGYWASNATSSITAELVVTYTYTGESNGHLSYTNLFGGQKTGVHIIEPTQYSTTQNINTFLTETGGNYSVIRGSSIDFSVNITDNDTTMDTDPNASVNVGTTSCTAQTNPALTLLESGAETAGHGIFVDVTSDFSASSASYSVCGVLDDPSGSSVDQYASNHAFQIKLTYQFSFDLSISITGTCKQADRSTSCDSDDGSDSIAVAINSTLQAQTDSVIDGSFNISGVSMPSAGAIITVFINNESDNSKEAVAVTKYDGSDNITINLYWNHLTIGSTDNQSLTNSDLSTYDNSVSGNENIFFDVTGSNLVADATTQGSGQGIYIESGNTYAPGGTVNLAGSWVNAGTFTHGSSTVTLNGTTSGYIINANNASGPFYNLTLNGSGGNWAVSSTAIQIANNLTVTDGTLSGDQNITVNGIVSGAGTINLTGGTFEYRPSNDQTFGTTSGSNNWTFNDLKFTSTKPADISSNTVNTSTSSQATGQSNQRRIFYDTSNSLFWYFYYNGSAIEYSNSQNGSSWTSRGTLAYNTSDFSVVYRPSSSTLYIAYISSGGRIRSGTLNSTSITWGDETIFAGSTEFAHAMLERASDGRIWAGAMDETGSAREITWMQSTNPDDLSTFEIQARVYCVACGSTTYYYPSTIPLTTSGDTVNIYVPSNGTSYVYYSTWDQSAQTEPVLPTSAFQLTNPTPRYPVSTVGLNSDTGGISYRDGSTAYFRSFTGGVNGSFGSAVTLGTISGSSGPVLAVDQNNSNNLYAFWVNSNVIYYKKGVSPYASGNWDANPTALVNIGTNDYITTALNNSNGKMIIGYTNGTGTPYNINFFGLDTVGGIVTNLITLASGGTGSIQVNGTLTLGSVSDTAQVNLNADTNDRILDIVNLNITSKGTLTASSSASFTVGGNFTNSGTFTNSNGTTTFDTTTTATISGDTIFNNISSTASGKTLQVTGGTTLTTNGLLTLNNITLTGAPGATTTHVVESANTSAVYSLIYDSVNSKYIAAGTHTVANSDAYVWESTNLTSWTPRIVANSVNSEDIYSIIHDTTNNKYIAAGVANGTGTVWESTNLTSWTARTVTGTVQLNKIIYVNSKYIAVGYNGVSPSTAILAESTNLTSWQVRTVDTTIDGSNSLLNDIIYDSTNNKYIVAGKDSTFQGFVWESTNLTSWTARQVGNSNEASCILFVNNNYLVGGNNGRLYQSTDLVSWNYQQIFSTLEIKSIIFNQTSNEYIVVNKDATVGFSKSTDLNTWTSSTPVNTSGSIQTAIITNSAYIFGGYNSDNDAYVSDSSKTWTINHQGTENISNTTISWSACHASSTDIDALTSNGNTDGGNNGTCWKFNGNTILVSGIVYLNDETTAYGTATAMKLSVNGSASTSTNSIITTGVFSFSISQPNNGSVLTLWLDTGGAGSVQGSLVFKYGTSCNGGLGNSCTGLKLIRDQVIVDNKHTGSIVNTDLAACDNNTGTGCNDTDIGFTSESGVLTLTWATNELKVASGVTFAPGNTVSAKKLDIDGTYTGASETLTLSGAGTSGTCTNSAAVPLCVTGTFTPNSNTVAFTSTSTTSINPGTFNHLSFTPAGTVTHTLLSGTYNVAGDLTVGSGANAVTLNANPASITLDVNGNVTIGSGATLSAPGAGKTFTVAGAWTNNNTFTTNSGTVTFDSTGGGTKDISNNGPFNILVFNGAGGAWRATGGNLVASSLTVTNGDLSTNSLNIYVSGDITVDGTISGTAGGTLIIRNDNSTLSGSGTITASNLYIGDEGDGTATINATGTGTVTVTGTMTIQANQSLNSTNKTFILSGTGTPLVVNGTLNASDTSTFRYTGNGATNIRCSGLSYYNLEIKPSGATGHTLCTGASQTLTVKNNLTIGDGTNAGVTAATRNPTINIGGNLNLANNTTYTKGSGTTTFNGTTASIITDNTTSKQNLGIIATNKTSGVPATDSVTLASSIKLDTLTIGTSDTWNMGASSYTLEVANAGATSAVLTNNGTFTAGTSTVNFSATNSGGNIIVPSLIYNSLTVSGAETYEAASGTLTVGATLTVGTGAATTLNLDTSDPTTDVNGSVTIATSGVLTASASAGFTIAGNFSNSGTFNSSNGTTTFDTTNTTIITGSTTFYNFIASTTGKTVEVDTGTTLTINGLLTLTGITLTRQSGDSNQWTINHQGTENISNTTISWSACHVSSTDIDAYTSNGNVDGTNNGICWKFSPPGIIVTGTLYNLLGSPITNSPSVTVKVNGSGNFSGSGNGSGVFNIPNIIAQAGNIVTAYINNGTNNAVFITKALDSSTTINLDLYENTIVLSHGGAASITNADIAQFDHTNDNDGDIGIDSDGTNVVVANGWRLLIKNSKTFEPGGTVSTTSSNDSNSRAGDLEIESGAVLNMNNHALNVGGDFINSGSFTYTENQTTTFSATAPGHTINNGTGNLNKVIFNGTGGGWSFTDASNTINDDLVVTAGTLSGTTNLTVNGGDVSGDGTINLTGGTFTLAGTPGANFGGNNPWTFNNLTIGSTTNTTYTATGSGSITVANTLTIDNGDTLNAGSKTWTLSNTGSPLVATGTFTAGSSTLQYTGATANIVAVTYNNLTLGGTGTYTLPASDITIRGNMIITSGAATTKSASNKLIFAKGGGSTQTLNTNGSSSDLGIIQVSSNSGNTTLALASSATISSITVDSSQTLSFNGSYTLTLTGSGTPLALNGQLIPSSGTISYTNPISATVANTTYNHLDFSPASGTPTYTLPSNTLQIDGNFSIGGAGNATVSALSNDTILNVFGNITIGNGDTFIASDLNSMTVHSSWNNSGTFTHSNQTVEFNSDSTGNTINTGGIGNPFYNLSLIGDGSWTVSGTAMQVDNDITVDANLNGTQNVTVNGGDVTGNGTINMTGGIFLVDGTSGTGFGGTTNWDFYNLTFGDGTGTTTTTSTGSGSITVSNMLTIASNQTLNAGSKTWTLSGSGTPLTRNGAFDASSSTFVYTSTTGTTALATAAMTGNNKFANLTINQAGQTFSTGVDLEILTGKNLVISGGILSLGTNNLTSYGNIKVGAGHSFVQTSGTTTIYANGTGNNCVGGTTTADCQGSGGMITFGNLIVGGDETVLTLTFNSTGQTINATSINIAPYASLNAGSASISLTGNGVSVLTKQTPGGTFTAGTSTITFNSTGTTGTTIPALTYYNLNLNKNGNLFTANPGNLTINNNLEITQGNFNLNTNDPTTVISGNLTISDSITLSDTNSLTLKGNLTNNGNFSAPSGSTVILDPSNPTQQIGGNNQIVFHNLTGNNLQNKLLQFKHSTETRAGGYINLSGARGEPLTLRSTQVNSQATLGANGGFTLNHVWLQDIACGTGLSSLTLGEQVYNGGNNGSCFGFIQRGGAVVNAPSGPSNEGNSGGGSNQQGGGQSGGIFVSAIGTAILTNNTVTSVTINSSGSNYASVPNVCFSGGGGSGAAAIATISNGSVNQVNITNPGSGYTSPPSVVFQGGETPDPAPPCGSGQSGGGAGGGGGASP